MPTDRDVVLHVPVPILPIQYAVLHILCLWIMCVRGSRIFSVSKSITKQLLLFLLKPLDSHILTAVL